MRIRWRGLELRNRVIREPESSSDFYPRLSMLVAHLNALGMRLAIQRPDGSFQVLPIDDFLFLNVGDGGGIILDTTLREE